MSSPHTAGNICLLLTWQSRTVSFHDSEFSFLSRKTLNLKVAPGASQMTSVEYLQDNFVVVVVVKFRLKVA